MSSTSPKTPKNPPPQNQKKPKTQHPMVYGVQLIQHSLIRNSLVMTTSIFFIYIQLFKATVR